MSSGYGRAGAWGVVFWALVLGATGCLGTAERPFPRAEAAVDPGNATPESMTRGDEGAKDSGSATQSASEEKNSTATSRGCPWGHLRCCDDQCAPASQCALLACDPSPQRTASETR